LVGIEPRDLLESIETPKEDAQGQEGAIRAIWEAMDGVARMSQRITKQTGQMIRIEAARTEKDQSPHEPLQAYAIRKNPTSTNSHINIFEPNKILEYGIVTS
jgi:hypothetical protein